MSTDRPAAPQSPRRFPQQPRPVRHCSPANQVRHDDLPLGARIANKVTAVFGSWGSIVTQSVLIVLWWGYNAVVAIRLPLAPSEADRDCSKCREETCSLSANHPLWTVKEPRSPGERTRRRLRDSNPGWGMNLKPH